MAGRVAIRDYGGYQIGAASLVLQVAAISAIVIGLIRAIRMRTPADGVFLLLGALMCFLTWRQAFYPKDMIRGLALAYVVLPAVLIAPRWPLGHLAERKIGDEGEDRRPKEAPHHDPG
jgi:hypothetical protein